jgi:hypothetical protein
MTELCTGCPKSPDAVLGGYISGTPGTTELNGISAKRCVSSLSFVWFFQNVKYLNF